MLSCVVYLYLYMYGLLPGTDENGELLNRFCGNTTVPDPVFSPSPNLWILFKSDASIVGQGFNLQYNFRCKCTCSSQS